MSVYNKLSKIKQLIEEIEIEMKIENDNKHNPVSRRLNAAFNNLSADHPKECISITMLLNKIGIPVAGKTALNQGGRWLRNNKYQRCQADKTRGYLVPVIQEIEVRNNYYSVRFINHSDKYRVFRLVNDDIDILGDYDDKQFAIDIAFAENYKLYQVVIIPKFIP